MGQIADALPFIRSAIFTLDRRDFREANLYLDLSLADRHETWRGSFPICTTQETAGGAGFYGKARLA